MSDETRELHRIISSSVRDMLDAYRIQAQAGPVSEQAAGGDHLPGGASGRGQPRALPGRGACCAAAKRGAPAAGELP